MKEDFPWYLEYFLEDILEGEKSFSAKRMFSWWSIFRNGKIFAFFSDGELYFRRNIFNENDERNRFFYFKKWKKILLPYYKVYESFLENRDELYKYIEASLDY